MNHSYWWVKCLYYWWKWQTKPQKSGLSCGKTASLPLLSECEHVSALPELHSSLWQWVLLSDGCSGGQRAPSAASGGSRLSSCFCLNHSLSLSLSLSLWMRTKDEEEKCDRHTNTSSIYLTHTPTLREAHSQRVQRRLAQRWGLLWCGLFRLELHQGLQGLTRM